MVRTEPFAQPRPPASSAQVQLETLPDAVETWLLAPVSAPEFSLTDQSGQRRNLREFKGKVVLLSFWISASEECRNNLNLFEQHHRRWAGQGLHLLTVNVDDAPGAAPPPASQEQQKFSFPILRANDDVAGVYNVLYRYLFDRYRDLVLPTAFLIDEKGEIVKLYQGPIQPQHVEDDWQHIPRNASTRLAKGLPFPGVIDSVDFQRNYLSFGSVFFQREYFEQAEASFQIALRDNPASAEASYGLGSVYLKQHKQKAAREYFERATQLQASYPDTLPNAWNNLGLIATQDGRMQEAVPYFEHALQLSADHLIALNNLANSYRQQKRWEEARQVFEHALAAHPEDAEASYGLGMVYAQLNDTDQAYEYLQQALRLRPGYPEALNNLGVLYLRSGRRDQAVASFEECIRVAPAFDQSYLNLARVHAIEGHPDQARDVLRQLLKLHPDHIQAQKALAELGQ